MKSHSKFSLIGEALTSENKQLFEALCRGLTNEQTDAVCRLKSWSAKWNLLREFYGQYPEYVAEGKAFAIFPDGNIYFSKDGNFSSLVECLMDKDGERCDIGYLTNYCVRFTPLRGTMLPAKKLTDSQKKAWFDKAVDWFKSRQMDKELHQAYPLFV